MSRVLPIQPWELDHLSDESVTKINALIRHRYVPTIGYFEVSLKSIELLLGYSDCDAWKESLDQIADTYGEFGWVVRYWPEPVGESTSVQIIVRFEAKK